MHKSERMLYRFNTQSSNTSFLLRRLFRECTQYFNKNYLTKFLTVLKIIFIMFVINRQDLYIEIET